MTPAVVQVMGWRSQQYGSFERFLVAVARRCADAGLASHFVFPSRPPSEAFLADAGAELHCVQSPRPPADPRFALAVRRIVRRVGATHLHAHFGLDAYHAVAAARHAGVPHRFATKHIAPGFSRLTLSRARHRWLARSVKRLFAISRRVADDLAALGVPEDKLELTYLGVDADAYRPEPGARAALHAELGLDPDIQTVLCTSHLRPDKGVAFLPDLAAALDRDPGRVCVLTAGQGALAEELARRAEELGLGEDRFRLLGLRLDVPRLLAAADVYLFPSGEREALGLAPLEAAAAGAPIVATAVSDLPELLGGVAYLAPPGDERAIVERCRAALADDSIGERRAAGRRLACERLSVQRAAEQHVDRYLG